MTRTPATATRPHDRAAVTPVAARWPARGLTRRLAPALVGAATFAVVSGCTVPTATPDTPTPRAGEADVAVVVSAPVTRVAGRLPARDRLAVRRDVESLLATYVRAAFVDPDAPDDPDETTFPGFTEGAAALAAKQGAVLTRADLDADGAVTVEVVSAEAPLSVLAPAGRVAGATARLDLALEVTAAATQQPSQSAQSTDPEGARDVAAERVRLRGRLLLSPEPDGWRVFGFDVFRVDR